MVYNLSNITTGTSHGILGFTQGVSNTLVGGWLGVMILMMLGTIFFMHFMYRMNDAGRALGATAFLCFGLSILLRAINLLPDLAMYICLLLTAGIIAFTFRN